jgi:hypothetical protein
MSQRNFRNPGRWRGPVKPVQKMDNSLVEMLFMHFLKLPPLLLDARHKIRSEHFDPDTEVYLRVLWESLLEVVARADYRGKKPGYMQLRALVTDRLVELGDAASEADSRALLTEPDTRDADEPVGLLYYTYKLLGDDADEIDYQTGKELLTRFLLEREIYDQKIAPLFVGKDQGVLPGDLTATIDDLARSVQTLAGLGGGRGMSLRPEAKHLIVRRPVFPPGIGFLTNVMNGFADGEIYGLMGPTGQGKTPLAIQAGLAMARHIKMRHLLHGEPLRTVHYFFYELDASDVLVRIWAPAAQIPKHRLLEAMVGADLTSSEDAMAAILAWPGWTTMTTPAAQRQEYEVELAKLAKVKVAELPGERERLTEAVDLLDGVFVPHEMSGDAGRGGATEVHAILMREADLTGRAPAFVIIDYLNDMVSRYLSATSRNAEDAMRHMISETIKDLRDRVAKSMRCAVFLLQQISGRFTRMPPTAPVHYSHASESSLFAENLYSCTALGNRDKDTGVQFLWHSKARNTARSFGHDIVRLDGPLQLFREVGDVMLVNGQLVTNDLADLTGGEFKTPKATKPTKRPPSIRGELDAFGD